MHKGQHVRKATERSPHLARGGVGLNFAGAEEHSGWVMSLLKGSRKRATLGSGANPTHPIPPCFPSPCCVQHIPGCRILSGARCRGLLTPSSLVVPHRHPRGLGGGFGIHIAPRNPPEPCSRARLKQHREEGPKTIPFPTHAQEGGDAGQDACQSYTGAEHPAPHSPGKPRPHTAAPPAPGASKAAPRAAGGAPTRAPRPTGPTRCHGGGGDPATLIWPLWAHLHDKSPILANLGDLPTPPARGVNGFSLPRPSCHFD